MSFDFPPTIAEQPERPKLAAMHIAPINEEENEENSIIPIVAHINVAIQ